MAKVNWQVGETVRFQYPRSTDKRNRKVDAKRAGTFQTISGEVEQLVGDHFLIKLDTPVERENKDGTRKQVSHKRINPQRIIRVL